MNFSIIKNQKLKVKLLLPNILYIILIGTILAFFFSSNTLIKNLEEILDVKGLDAILIGPYDLSSSLGITGKFNHKKFKDTVLYIKKISRKKNIPVGVHVLENNPKVLKNYMNAGFSFLPYCTDAMLLNKAINSSFKKK